MRDLPRWLSAGDALVVNDAATLPASLRGRTVRGEPIELRLLGLPRDGRARGVLLGAGDFRTRTEHRAAPPPVDAGDVLAFGDLSMIVVSHAPLSPRLLELRVEGSDAEAWAALYRHGRPIQYAHHARALPLFAFQTVYAARPWAAEMPSAGRPLSWSLLLELRRRGVQVLPLTHAAALSATGEPAIDAALPLPERFEIPAATVEGIARAHAGGGRVIAVGTSVVRALEGCAALHGGTLVAAAGETDLIIDEGYERRVAHGLLTGMHEPSESHYRLLRAFASEGALANALTHAAASDYRSHEFGDTLLVLAKRRSRAAA
jgi:S-adenosylmethionine:tRNA ribosyltransferase-isomerase